MSKYRVIDWEHNEKLSSLRLLIHYTKISSGFVNNRNEKSLIFLDVRSILRFAFLVVYQISWFFIHSPSSFAFLCINLSHQEQRMSIIIITTLTFKKKQIFVHFSMKITFKNDVARLQPSNYLNMNETRVQKDSSRTMEPIYDFQMLNLVSSLMTVFMQLFSYLHAWVNFS